MQLPCERNSPFCTGLQKIIFLSDHNWTAGLGERECCVVQGLVQRASRYGAALADARANCVNFPEGKKNIVWNAAQT